MFGEWSAKEKRLLAALAVVTFVLLSVLLYHVLERENDEPSLPAAVWPAEETVPATGSLAQEGMAAAGSPAAGPAGSGEKNGRKEIVVDVKGAVARPGVYTFGEGTRAYEAIEKAGGLLDTADEDRVNLAAPLADGAVLYVPAKGEEIPPSYVSGNAPAAVSAESGNGGPSGGLIDINTATSEQLQQLPGIGPAKAEAIIAYREEHGPFRSVEELTKVSGIGEKTLEKIRSRITVK
ncbi:hypothetical protein BSNK01_04390 [Bacillaceae bacterium]